MSISGSLLDELRSAAEKRGYDLTLIGRRSGQNGESYYDHARRRNLDGVVVIQADFDSANVIRLASSDMPSVVIDHVYEGCDCVSSDNRASMERIVRHAYDRGHRIIACITDSRGCEPRAAGGFLQRLRGAGHPSAGRLRTGRAPSMIRRAAPASCWRC